MKLRSLLPLFAFLSAAVALCAAGNHTKGAEVAQVSQGAEINLADYVEIGRAHV